MKTKLFIGVLLLAATFAPAQTNDLTSLLQQGLLEEQANRNLDAAITAYQNLAIQFDKDRQLAATAIFRLGECYRAQGRTNEAALQYQRILHDFSDQPSLATLSRQDLLGMGMATDTSAATARQQQKDLLAKQIALAEEDLADKQRMTVIGQIPPAEIRAAEREVLRLRQQLIALDSNPQDSMGSPVPTGSEEDQEIQHIQQMIQNSPDLINGASAGSIPLVKAAYSGWQKVAAYLLEHGADVNTPAPDVRWTEEMAYGPVSPLAASVAAGNKAMTEFLINHGAEVNFKLRDLTMLQLAAKKGFQAVAEVLLANHADVNAKNAHGTTPLFFAAQSGQLKLVQTMLAAGADPKARDVDGWTALNYAMGNSPEIFRSLLNAGTDPNTEDKGFSRTPLSHAVQKGNLEVIKLLLAAKADPNAGWDPPLLRAIQENSIASAEILLRAGADPNLKRQAGRVVNMGPNQLSNLTPIFSAVQTKQLAMVQMLLKFKADPNDSQTDVTPLLFAALDQPEILKTLIAAGASVDARSPEGHTPLGAAVVNQYLPTVQLLLDAKADPNADQGPRSPAIFAALSDTNLLEALLAAGANLEAHDQTIEINGERPNWTPLAAAAWNLNIATVEILLKHGANPNAQDAAGNVPLHWALSWVHGQLTDQTLQIVKALLDHGADPNRRKNNSGDTPLDWVKRRLPKPVGANGIQTPYRFGASPAPTPDQTRLAEEIIALLRQHGALDKLPDWDHITVSRPSSDFSFALFQKGTNDWNQFTVLETIMNFYGASLNYPVSVGYGGTTLYSLNSMLPFPDLAHVTIIRPSPNSTNESRMVIDFLGATNGIDCSKDTPLIFGDVVEVPERDHPLGEDSYGLTESQRAGLYAYVIASARLVVHGQTVQLQFARIGDQAVLGNILNQPEARKVLLSSSDLSRVKVIRHDPKTGKSGEWVVDCSQKPSTASEIGVPMRNPGRPIVHDASLSSELWLCNGDVIEVPEKP